MKTLLVTAILLALPGAAFAGEGMDEGKYGPVSGLVAGGAIGYAQPRGHDYHGQLEDGLDSGHLFVGYRAFSLFEIEASFFDTEAPVKGSNHTASVRSFSLDSRFLMPMGPVIPNVLVGYSPKADLSVKFKDPVFGDVSEDAHGNSWNLGGGARFVVMPNFWLSLDVRHQFLRYQKLSVSSGGTTFSGTPSSELRGDITSVMVGGGLQF